MLRDRIRKMNCPMYDIQLPQGIRDVAVPREFISSLYGGNSQETFPKVGKMFLERHGINDFMFPSLEYNPDAAQIPGAPGLFFVAGKDASGEFPWGPVQRVITRIEPNNWLYVGQYTFKPAESLSLQELEKLPLTVSRVSISVPLITR